MTEMLESVESGDWPIDVRVNWTDTTEWKNKCFDFRSQDLLSPVMNLNAPRAIWPLSGIICPPILRLIIPIQLYSPMVPGNLWSGNFLLGCAEPPDLRPIYSVIPAYGIQSPTCVHYPMGGELLSTGCYFPITMTSMWITTNTEGSGRLWIWGISGVLCTMGEARRRKGVFYNTSRGHCTTRLGS